MILTFLQRQKIKEQGRKEASESLDVTLKKPLPTVITREEPNWATKPELEEHIGRTDKQFAEIRHALQVEREVARVSLGKIHQRIDIQSERTAEVQATVNEVKGTVNKLLDIALNR